MENEKFTSANSKSVTIRIPNDLYEQIVKLAKTSDRKTSEQIRFMIKKYIEIKEKD